MHFVRHKLRGHLGYVDRCTRAVGVELLACARGGGLPGGCVIGVARSRDDVGPAADSRTGGGMTEKETWPDGWSIVFIQFSR